MVDPEGIGAVVEVDGVSQIFLAELVVKFEVVMPTQHVEAIVDLVILKVVRAAVTAVAGLPIAPQVVVPFQDPVTVRHLRKPRSFLEMTNTRQGK